MSRRAEMRRWTGRALFLIIALTAIYLPLLPFGMDRGGRAWPDVLFAVTAAWIVRRPDDLPFLLVAAVGFVADLMLSRPPGLWALIFLLAMEFLRVQRHRLIDRPFPVEWLTVSITFGIALMMQTLLLIAAFVPLPGGDLTWQVFALTVVAYPVAVAVLRFGLVVRAPKPAERGRSLGRLA